MAPSKILRHLGHDHLQEYGETDSLLIMALHHYDSVLLCSCCGQLRGEAWDPDTDGEWEIDEGTVCYAGAAIQRYRKDEAEKAEPGTLPAVRRVHVERDVPLGG